ncbi:Oxidoreductase [Lachnellula willkommii]|uniref:Oxidoreductase n=1 Tax=Lachnellula willkommii TaxID=215461 RepID=A0A559M7L8_9HELO|nr:Oxidoreductase [Lachnellula willkommii]
MPATTTVETKVDTPFTAGALKSGSSVPFWESYIRSRPSPPEDFFRLIHEYHKGHGDSTTGLAHDVGTGPGNIARRLTAYFDKVVGSDLNDNALQTAPFLIPAETLERMKFIHSKAEDLRTNVPAEHGGQGTTDLITVSECMPLLDPTQALKAFNILLRPGGSLAIYFYGPAIYTDGNVERCNALYDQIATRICSFSKPMKGTPSHPFYLRGAETLLSYMDNIAMPEDDWEFVERHKWSPDFPLLFNSKEGFDFEFEHVDRTTSGETVKQYTDREYWGAHWSIDELKSYLDSVYPNWHDKAGSSGVAEVDSLLAQLDDAMGREKRKVTFPTVLILATKKGLQNGHHSAAAQTKASRVALSLQQPGLGRISPSTQEAVDAANRLLQKNHDENHIFWRDFNGHNHMAHSLLTTFAMGGSASEIQRAYDDGIPIQRPMPSLDPDVANSLSDDGKLAAAIGDVSQYSNVLAFFERQIDEHGWKSVLQRYCFSRTSLADAILSRAYEGAYHSFIHIGLGVEFEQPSIIAEGLAQAMADTWSGIPDALLETDKIASSRPAAPARSLVDLLTEARNNDIIYRGPRWDDFAKKMMDGVLGRSRAAILNLAAQFRVDSSNLATRAAEVANCSAYLAGAAQRSHKVPKIDFFFMHAVTSSIFLTVLLQESWISEQDKVRLVEWKGRTDILWYAACGCPELKASAISDYPAAKSWEELYRAVNLMHDDGHVAKFVRAIKSAEEVSQAVVGSQPENSNRYPMQGDMWLKLAGMAYDSTYGLEDPAKWVWGVGFEQAWGNVPARS